MTKKRIALLSVYDKTGIAEFAESLIEIGFTILSSGGTAKVLTDSGLEVLDTADFTGLKAILGHRVATLHPKIYAGLLALDNDEHKAELLKEGYEWIDLVCVDFYPLKEEIKKSTATPESVIEKTDIGGPTMIRASVKGKRITICDPVDRPTVIQWLKDGEPSHDGMIEYLGSKAEFVISQYCADSAIYHSKGKYQAIFGEKFMDLRYGENPYQTPAAVYVMPTDFDDPLALNRFKILAGNPSMVNMTDVDRGLQTITHIAAGFDVNFHEFPRIAVGLKHGNPCGAAYDDSRKKATEMMLTGNPISIFGGTVIVNFEIHKDVARMLVTDSGGGRRPLDILIASGVDEESLEILRRKNDRCLVMVNPALNLLTKESLDTVTRFRYVRGGFILQPNYTYVVNLKNDSIKEFGYMDGASERECRDLVLAWAICNTSTSNTITIVKDRMLLANAVGQQDRVGAVELALSIMKKAGHDPSEAVAVSDSFFPFPDAPQLLLDSGVATILTTSGSVNDQATIDLFAGHTDGRTLLMIPDKEGRGFYAH
ncbi:MAG: hypothetical protein KBD48_03830 [Candidatus Pacebacteria bacterium]|nr:hypothetical protein [Candidatus Paceibacterota bacterium]